MLSCAASDTGRAKMRPFCPGEGALQFDERETGDFLEVALIPGCHRVPRSKAHVPISRSSRGMVTPLADDSR